MLNKQEYLNSEHVKGFIDFFVQYLDGNLEVNMEVTFVDKKIPANYSRNQFFSSIEDAFSKYYWDKKDFKQNSDELLKIQNLFDEVKNASDKNVAIIEAVTKCMKWGLGESAGQNNINWAKNTPDIYDVLMNALKLMLTDNINLKDYIKSNQFRMNSGYTKVYALMSPNHFAIYDSRVAAALGWFIVKYCQQKQLNYLPDELHFYVMRSSNNRNPSIGNYKFQYTNQDDFKHAKSNIKFNWILQAALEKSQATWHGNDMRKVEAALFMLGYDLPR